MYSVSHCIKYIPTIKSSCFGVFYCGLVLFDVTYILQGYNTGTGAIVLGQSFRVTALALGQSYDCPSAIDATLRIWADKLIKSTITDNLATTNRPHILHYSDVIISVMAHDCLLNRLFRCRSKRTSKLRVTGLCAGKSPVTGEFSHKGPVTRWIFPYDHVIMYMRHCTPPWSCFSPCISCQCTNMKTITKTISSPMIIIPPQTCTHKNLTYTTACPYSHVDFKDAVLNKLSWISCHPSLPMPVCNQPCQGIMNIIHISTWITESHFIHHFFIII